ncbi:Hsp70 family protein [Actinokineospora sp. PR83]|uniref:Hsp70 family protein n=1 Tax=Actinokineospora sp. PR83 TaxID=2884908 RepID=UPI0027E1BCB6|nr:Hsp70 family protein [Actinokineospora sp. PR83]MCG8916475.1 Hsp70 family protein [Actinokineospora sp. PR83]
MGYGLGIDLGTTFTAAAVARESGTRVVPLGEGGISPSLVYARADGTLVTGEAAEAEATDPARLSRGHKRRLGDPTPLVIGGAAYSPAALLAAQLRDVVAAVTAQEGEAPESVVLTCPAVWGPYRREHFDEVPRLAGLSGARIITEPEAAATHYSVERRLGEGELVAVYDLGGGTFDTTVLRAAAGGMEILGTPEGIERLGGMDFDEALLAHVDTRLDGAVSALDPADPEAAAALAAIRALCVRAKEELSTEPDVLLQVPLPGGGRELLVTRIEFNEMIRPAIALTTEALERTITSAGLKADDLAAVLLAGGSSRIPLVTQMVSEAFGRPVRVGLHPKFTVALGAAAVSRTPAVEQPAAVVPPPGTPLPAPRSGRPKWLVPAAAAAAVLLVAAATTATLIGGGADTPAAPQGGALASPVPPTTTTSAAAATTAPQVATGTSQVIAGPPPVAPTTARAIAPPTSRATPGIPEVKVYDGSDVSPFQSIIGSEENWDGTYLGGRRAAEHTEIRVGPDRVGGADGLRATWTGRGPAQLYFQDPGFRDMSAYLDDDAALVFDAVVHRPPTSWASVAVHCEYPCGGQVELTSLLNVLPPGRVTTVRIPISCFVADGLDPKHVDTFMLLYSEEALDVSVANVRWTPGAADEPDALDCGGRE